jgi:hypothetical protein
MANIPKMGPWIPGQQLYGTMIPRQEHETILFQQEVEQERQRLIAFEQRVKDILASEVMSLEDRMRLYSMGIFLDGNMPSAVGYEVVPHSCGKETDEDSNFDEDEEDDDEMAKNDKDDDDKDNDDRDDHESDPVTPLRERKVTRQAGSRTAAKSLSKRFSVIQTDDKNPFISLHRASNQIVLERDQFSTYEVLSAQPYHGDEEGVEIVGLGRFSTAENNSRKLLPASDESSSEGWETDIIGGREATRRHGGLSPVMYQSSERIALAFYRPEQ